jgi:hypothetical protein
MEHFLNWNLSFFSTVLDILAINYNYFDRFCNRTNFTFPNNLLILLTIVVIMRPGYGLTNERDLPSHLRHLIRYLLGEYYFCARHYSKSKSCYFSYALGFTYTPSNYKISNICNHLSLFMRFNSQLTWHNNLPKHTDNFSCHCRRRTKHQTNLATDKKAVGVFVRFSCATIITPVAQPLL